MLYGAMIQVFKIPVGTNKMFEKVIKGLLRDYNINDINMRIFDNYVIFVYEHEYDIIITNTMVNRGAETVKTKNEMEILIGSNISKTNIRHE